MWRSLLHLIDENGIITHFDVKYSSILTGTTIANVPANHLYVELGGLEEYTEYSVRVAAATSVGTGPFSSAQTVTTLEDGMLSVSIFSYCSAKVFFHFPQCHQHLQQLLLLSH